MTDQQQPHSGSRWEPAPSDASTPPPPVHPPVNPVPYAATSPRARTRRARGRRTLAGATIGLVAAGSLGGFALGQLNAPVSEVGRTGQVGTGFTPDRQAPPAPPAGDDDGGVPPGGTDHGSVEGTDTAYHS
ncbi:hypothetical protein GCM10009844_43380 [Nocardioides koreensis]|uniref:Serine protease n=1 Tax=Nocardioides koreensis TaxID=433651 RepID=A0ABN3A8C5_9ACTN